MNQGNQRPSYNEIKEYIRKLLGDIKEGNTNGALESFNSLTREVFIKAYNQNLDEVRRVYEIPNPKENPIGFRAAWVDVFLGCLIYYKQKVQKEGTRIFETPNLIIINGEECKFNNLLEYIDRLEQISEENDKQKQNTEFNPVVSSQSILVGSNQIKKEKTNLYNQIEASKIESTVNENINKKEEIPNPIAHAKLTSTFPKGEYSITSAKLESDINPEYDMSISKTPTKRENIKKETNSKTRKKVNYQKFKQLQQTRFISQKLPENDVISLNDLEELRRTPLIFISGSTSNKVETAFIDNIELLNENGIEAPKAAFISEKATTSDKVTKEAMKILKMCLKNIDSGIICCEIDNDKIRYMENDKDVLEAFRSSEQIADILQNEGYSPLICTDLDVRDKINDALSKNEPNHMVKYPVLSRISSKELDDVNDNDDLIVMHSGLDNDQVMLTDYTKNYIMEAINKNVNLKKAPSKAAWCFFFYSI